MLGGIEAGGTKFVCGAGSSPADLVREEFPTGSPQQTIERVVGFFHRHPVEAIGIGCFGPVDLKTGTITTTPKTAWQNFPIVERIRQATTIRKVAFDTDVNAAAFGEYTWGAAQSLHTFLYLTVGTGIGGGAMVDGRLLHGLAHPEMGHIRIPHDLARDPFPGGCYAHGDCLEGLASGPAMEARWKASAKTLPEEHPAWELEAHYLALALATLTCAFSPQKIVIGGGVMNRLNWDVLREKLAAFLNGYTAAPEVVPPALQADAGVLGAIALAAGV